MLPIQFTAALPIIHSLEAHGHVAFFVGGAVRDFLLERPIHDIDIVTSARVEELDKIFEQVIPVGIEHGTVIVRYNHVSYEVTSFRGKLYNDVLVSLADDLRLRDFTMNAIAMNQHGKIYDYFHGKIDIQNKIIRAVENPSARFEEDPLRLLRVFRFMSELSFTIDPETFKTVTSLKHQLQDVAVERITQEWEKILQAPYLKLALQELHTAGLFDFLPMFQDEQSFIPEMLRQNSPFDSFASFIAYFHYYHEDVSVATWVKAWKLSNKTKNKAIQLYKFIRYYEENKMDARLLYELTDAFIPSFLLLLNKLSLPTDLTVKSLQAKRRTLPIQSRKELQVTGHDLINWFPSRRQGSWIRTAIWQIEQAVLCREINNNKNEIKEWILCHPPDIN